MVINKFLYFILVAKIHVFILNFICFQCFLAFLDINGNFTENAAFLKYDILWPSR